MQQNRDPLGSRSRSRVSAAHEDKGSTVRGQFLWGAATLVAVVTAYACDITVAAGRTLPAPPTGEVAAAYERAWLVLSAFAERHDFRPLPADSTQWERGSLSLSVSMNRSGLITLGIGESSDEWSSLGDSLRGAFLEWTKELEPENR